VEKELAVLPRGVQFQHPGVVFLGLGKCATEEAAGSQVGVQLQRQGWLLDSVKQSEFLSDKLLYGCAVRPRIVRTTQVNQHRHQYCVVIEPLAEFAGTGEILYHLLCQISLGRRQRAREEYDLALALLRSREGGLQPS
jgi:hypothetical protein